MQFQHFLHILPGVQKTAPAVRQAAGFGSTKNHRSQQFVGAQRLTASLEQNGVAAFQAEGGNLNQRVGPAFKNDADHADGTADPV